MERIESVKDKLLSVANEPSMIFAEGIKNLCSEASEVIVRLTAELEKTKQLQSEPTCSLKELERAERQRDEAYAAIRAIERASNYPLENRPCSVCRYIGLYCSSGGSSCRGFKWVGFSKKEEAK